MARASGQDLAVGINLRHYRIVEKIGAGGMGEVYRAHDQHLDRDVAIKILPADVLADAGARKQFRKEALVLAKLNHPRTNKPWRSIRRSPISRSQPRSASRWRNWTSRNTVLPRPSRRFTMR